VAAPLVGAMFTSWKIYLLLGHHTVHSISHNMTNGKYF